MQFPTKPVADLSKMPPNLLARMGARIHAPSLLFALALIASVAYLAMYALFYWQFGQLNGPSSLKQWAELGDFVNGNFSPLIGMVTVIGLAMTLWMQNEQMRFLQSEIINGQRRDFENRFFAALQILREHRDRVKFEVHSTNSDGVTSARMTSGADDLFQWIDAKFQEAVDTARTNWNLDLEKRVSDASSIDEKNKIYSEIFDAQSAVYEANEDLQKQLKRVLEPYRKTLAAVLRTVHTSELPKEARDSFADLTFAQLSYNEWICAPFICCGHYELTSLVKNHRFPNPNRGRYEFGPYEVWENILEQIYFAERVFSGGASARTEWQENVELAVLSELRSRADKLFEIAPATNSQVPVSREVAAALDEYISSNNELR